MCLCLLVIRSAGLPQYGQLGHGTDNEVECCIVHFLLCVQQEHIEIGGICDPMLCVSSVYSVVLKFLCSQFCSWFLRLVFSLSSIIQRKVL